MAMTVTVAADCSQVTIESPLIDAWIAAFPDGDDLQLNVTYQCGTAVEITLDDSNLDMVENEYVLLPAALSQSGITLCDGVYFLELISTDDVGATTTEYYCLFIDCVTKCAIIDYLAENLTSNIYGLYEALTWISLCSRPECKCEEGCVIYNKIVSLINAQAEKASTTSSDCGCG